MPSRITCIPVLCTTSALFTCVMVQLACARTENKTCRCYTDVDLSPGHHLLPGDDAGTEPCNLQELPPGLWTKTANSSGRMLVGTTFAQNFLWQHQHPAKCGQPHMRFAVFAIGEDVEHRHGIGSMVHILGVALGLAVQANRTFIIGRHSSFYWGTGARCQDADSIDQCWLQPMSSCSLRDVLGGTDDYDAAAEAWPHLDVVNRSQSEERVVKMHNQHRLFVDHKKVVPQVFHALLDTAGIPQKKWFYWWRAQSAAYILRLRQPSEMLIDRHRDLIHPSGDLPLGTVSMFLRRGDKIIESALCSDLDYERALASMLQSTGLPHQVYLATDDSETRRYFDALPDVLVTCTDVARHHSGAAVRVYELADELGFDRALADDLVSLHLSLQGDAFITDLSSNWARLIDELRSTVRCRAHVPFWDIRQPIIDQLHW